MARRPDQGGVARILRVDGDGRVAQQRLRARRRDRDPGVRVGQRRSLRRSGGSASSRGCPSFRSGSPPGPRRWSGSRGTSGSAPRSDTPALRGRGAGTPRARPRAETSSIVKRSRLMSSEAPTRRCWLRIVSRVSRTNSHIASRYFSRPRVWRVSPFFGEDLVQDVLGGDRGVVQAGQEERRPALHSGVAGHQVFDGGALGVAQVQRAGHVGRRLDDDERLLGPVGARALAVRVEDVGVEPALEDGVLDVARAGRPWPARPSAGPSAPSPSVPAAPGFFVFARPPSLAPSIKGPARPADERVVVPPAGSDVRLRLTSWACHAQTPGAAHRVGRRSPSRRAIGRLPHCSRATFAPFRPRGFQPAPVGAAPFSACRLAALLLSVNAVKAPIVAQGTRRSGTRGPGPPCGRRLSSWRPCRAPRLCSSRCRSRPWPPTH